MAKITLQDGPFTIEFTNVTDLLEYKRSQLGNAPPADSPRRPQSKKVAPKARQASIAYAFAHSMGGMPSGSAEHAQLVREWTEQGIVATKATRRRSEVTGRKRSLPAGRPYSPNTARPWLIAAERAVAAGWTVDTFVAAALLKGSKVGNSCNWKP